VSDPVRCHACGAIVRVTRTDHPDPVTAHVLHVYALQCPRNQVHVHAQQGVVARRRNDETPPHPEG
jgi:hypothetical protein